MNISIYKKAGLFFGLSTLIPWTFWFVAGYISHLDGINNEMINWASMLAFLGLLSPVIVAIVLAKKDQQILNDLGSRIFNFKRKHSTYILLAFGLMPLSILLAQATSLIFGYGIEQFHLAESFSFTSGIFPVWFMLLIAPLLEELAWHSYGTDALRRKYNLFTTSMIFAIFWGIWHLPLSTINDYYHSNLVEQGWIYSANFLISLIPFVIIMNWIYYKTDRNIILPIIFHIAAGYFNEVFATHPMSKVIQTVLLCLFAAYIMVTDKKFFFSRKFMTENNDKLITRLENTKYRWQALLLVLLFFGSAIGLSAQDITQSIKGYVYDEITRETLPFANIVIKDSDPLIGTVSDIDGNYSLNDISIGRHTIQFSMVGYDTYEIKELLVSSGELAILNVGLEQSSNELDEVVVRVSKSTPINSMSTLSSRQFTVEETQRYAGGLNDPARLASSFAGVSNPSISNNGISVRGNSPDGLLWRIEGVEVPTPNHFPNLTVAGGGLLSSISNQVMSNSDFYTGAFPAEYGNSYSGVFDIKLRDGNRYDRKFAFEAGILGVGAMAQGPYKKGTDETYIINYRNSTMALLAPLLPSDAGVLKYQDLSFKTSIPTNKYGTFTLWGIGMIDGVDHEALDSTEWESHFDRDNSRIEMNMYTTSLVHKISLPGNTFLKTSATFSGNKLDFTEERLDDQLMPHPQSSAHNNSTGFTIQSEISRRFSDRHSNKSGIRYNRYDYHINVTESPYDGLPPVQIVDQSGSTGLLQMFTQSKINFSSNWVMNAGVNAQYLDLNNNWSIEPRIGLKYQINNYQNLSAAYGIHSRMEQLPVYFALVDGDTPNEDLKFMRSSHYVLSYKAKLGENLQMTIEPYYQKLSNVPVSPEGYVSTLNNNNSLFFDDLLESEGEGRNIGIDLTVEKFLSKGYYYMFTTSLFDSKYTGSDGIERNTRFNRNYVFNIIAGKEWRVRSNNIFSVNARMNYLGGNRIEPVDLASSLGKKDVVYAETEGNRAFRDQHEALPVVSLTISYRKNMPNYSSVWSLQILNVTGAEEYSRDFYNLDTGTIDIQSDGIVIPNLSYRIEF
ncbi:MAG: CPBP family intramembrane metalloprotease [Saprospiraceae bacterium]|nr:CPBP family intramembrane metalloprotease [Saprospiraceae bacterium]